MTKNASIGLEAPRVAVLLSGLEDETFESPSLENLKVGPTPIFDGLLTTLEAANFTHVILLNADAPHASNWEATLQRNIAKKSSLSGECIQLKSDVRTTGAALRQLAEQHLNEGTPAQHRLQKEEVDFLLASALTLLPESLEAAFSKHVARRQADKNVALTKLFAPGTSSTDREVSIAFGENTGQLRSFDVVGRKQSEAIHTEVILEEPLALRMDLVDPHAFLCGPRLLERLMEKSSDFQSLDVDLIPSVLNRDKNLMGDVVLADVLPLGADVCAHIAEPCGLLEAAKLEALMTATEVFSPPEDSGTLQTLDMSEPMFSLAEENENEGSSDTSSAPGSPRRSADEDLDESDLQYEQGIRAMVIDALCDSALTGTRLMECSAWRHSENKSKIDSIRVVTPLACLFLQKQLDGKEPDCREGSQALGKTLSQTPLLEVLKHFLAFCESGPLDVFYDGLLAFFIRPTLAVPVPDGVEPSDIWWKPGDMNPWNRPRAFAYVLLSLLEDLDFLEVKDFLRWRTETVRIRGEAEPEVKRLLENRDMTNILCLLEDDDEGGGFGSDGGSASD